MPSADSCPPTVPIGCLLALPFDAFIRRAKAFCELPFGALPSADPVPGDFAKDFAGDFAGSFASEWGLAVTPEIASEFKRFAGKGGCSARGEDVCPSTG